MVVVEAARRGKQLGEVHGFAVAAVEFLDLGAAAESVGEDLRARRGFPQPGQQGALGAGFRSPRPADLEAEVAGEAAAAGLQVPGLAPAAASSSSSASEPSMACWCQCTWVSTGRRTAPGVYPAVCSESSSARVSVWSRSRSTRQSSRQQVAEHSESTRLQYALAERGRGAGRGRGRRWW